MERTFWKCDSTMAFSAISRVKITVEKQVKKHLIGIIPHTVTEKREEEVCIHYLFLYEENGKFYELITGRYLGSRCEDSEIMDDIRASEKDRLIGIIKLEESALNDGVIPLLKLVPNGGSGYAKLSKSGKYSSIGASQCSAAEAANHLKGAEANIDLLRAAINKYLDLAHQNYFNEIEKMKKEKASQLQAQKQEQHNISELNKLLDSRK